MSAHTRKVNCAIVVSIDFVDHVLQFGFRRVLAERTHDGSKLLGCDLACTQSVRMLLLSQLSGAQHKARIVQFGYVCFGRDSLTIAVLVLYHGQSVRYLQSER